MTDLGHGVHLIDTRMSGYEAITAGYLVLADRPCLVETGTARSAPVVQAALADHGLGPDDLATVVVSHIHLDHAGGVGHLAAAFPRASIVVHAEGARHLVEPQRLMASARRVYGEALLGEVFGELAPTPAERLSVVEDTAEIDLGGGRRLSAYHSPGHAKHHLGLLDSASGDLYVGDAAGIYVPEADLLRPNTPPPDFDLDLALGSLGLFAELAPTRLLFSHYGPVEAAEATLARSAEELRVWVELARETRADGLDLGHAVALVRQRSAARHPALAGHSELADKHERLSSTEANLTGVLRWLDRADDQEPGTAGPP